MSALSDPLTLVQLPAELWDNIFSYILPDEEVIERKNVTSYMLDSYDEFDTDVTEEHCESDQDPLTYADNEDPPPLRHDRARCSLTPLRINIQLWEIASRRIYNRTFKISISGLMISFLKSNYRSVCDMPAFPFGRAQLIHIEVANPMCVSLYKGKLFENLLGLCYRLDFSPNLRLRIDSFENATNVIGIHSLDSPMENRISDFAKLLEPFKLLRAVEEVELNLPLSLSDNSDMLAIATVCETAMKDKEHILYESESDKTDRFEKLWWAKRPQRREIHRDSSAEYRRAHPNHGGRRDCHKAYRS